MKTSWIVVSNSSAAHIYSSPRAKLLNGHSSNSLNLVKELSHPKSRLKKGDLLTDRLGQNGPTQYALTSDPVDVEVSTFAREIINLLEAARVNHEYDDLILVSPSHFLGKLHSFLKDHPSLNTLVSAEIHKDYFARNTDKLLEGIKGHL